MNYQLFIKTLKSNRLSATGERRALFSILDSQDQPITMSQLVNASSPTLNRSTVYRSVELFEKIGIITRVYTGWKYRVELSELFSHHHHHISCSNCDNIVSFHESSDFDNYVNKIAKQNGFRLTSHSLELKGLCKNCLNL